MGQVAHYLEENGFSTVTLTNTPEFHRQVGIPRVAAIEYPYGRPVGQVHDQDGQRNVLKATLSVLENAKEPGQISHLPFTWPEEPKKTDWHPSEISPIAKLNLAEIKRLGAKMRKKK